MMGWSIPDTPATYVKLIRAIDRKQFAVHLDPCNIVNSPEKFYRNADLLLLLAEAKIAVGEDPSTEINLVRARAYGTNYNPAIHAYPNQPVDANAKEAILQERFFEFIFEGKRWYDLRRMGDSYVFANTTVPASETYKLLWPVDRNSLTNNRALEQTAGYPSF